MSQSVRRLFVHVCLLALLAGCSSSSSPFDYVKVSGKVRYEDGTPLPLKGFVLKFYALDAPSIEGAKPRVAQASVDSQGNFDQVTSHKYGDGLIPGRHRVAFFYATDASGRSVVPEDYAMPGSSPLIIDTADAPLEIRVPKP